MATGRSKKTITGPLAALLAGVYDGSIRADVPSFPRPTSAVWGEFEFALTDAELVFEAGLMNLLVRGRALDEDAGFDEMRSRLNDPARLRLEDGSELQTRLCTWTGQSTSIRTNPPHASHTNTIELIDWDWQTLVTPNYWIGPLVGSKIDDSNLTIHSGDSWSARHLRVEANYDVHIVVPEKGAHVVVIDANGKSIDHDAMGNDFTALEFALGRPLRLDYLIGLDDDRRAVGVAGLQFGGRYTESSGTRCPVAGAMDLYALTGEKVAEHTWVPVLASRVATRLQAEGVDSPLCVATAAYLDSLTGHVHAQYLLAQVALEAFCRAVVAAQTNTLVKDPGEWRKFVHSKRNEIATFASDAEAGRKLVNKVESAQHAPSSDRVLTALRHFDINAPEVALREVSKRNTSAHSYLMAKESELDVQEVADRLAIIQTLLTAVVAKYVGFEGPILGWEWINGRHKVPDWWKWTKQPEAAIAFTVGATAKSSK